MDAVTSQLVMGIIPLVIGIGLIYWISRRKFYRRNAMGAEGFSSFEASVFIRFIERVGKWIAYALIILGVVILWSYTQMKKEREKNNRKLKLNSLPNVDRNFPINLLTNRITQKAIRFFVYGKRKQPNTASQRQ